MNAAPLLFPPSDSRRVECRACASRNPSIGCGRRVAPKLPPGLRQQSFFLHAAVRWSPVLPAADGRPAIAAGKYAAREKPRKFGISVECRKAIRLAARMRIVERLLEPIVTNVPACSEIRQTPQQRQGGEG